jgi:hypothetical protein
MSHGGISWALFGRNGRVNLPFRDTYSEEWRIDRAMRGQLSIYVVRARLDGDLTAL